MNTIPALLCGVFLLLAPNLSSGQRNLPVLWDFRYDPLTQQEVVLSLTARLAPGWHLYSQFIKEGGPRPTRITFQRNDDYSPEGKTEEKGNPVKFLDDIYEMEITWYTVEVSFLQKIRLTRPATTIAGTIEYMVCDDHLCIPLEQNFSVAISPLKKYP